MRTTRFLLAASSLLFIGHVAAEGRSAFVMPGGFTAHGTSIVSAGVAWPLAWRYSMGGLALSSQVEALASVWHAPQTGGGYKNFVQVAAVPILRLRPGENSPFFAEAGIGVSFTDDVYVSRRKTFSTRFNFYDTVGLGMNLGARREHEVGLRYTHISNAGIKHPNPGENFLQLRYAHSF